MSSVKVDLDILRPKVQMVTLGGKEFNVSFIPVGLTFEIDDLVNRIGQLDIKKLNENVSEEIKKAFDLSIELCSTFTSFFYPEIDANWFLKNTSANQVGDFANLIKETLKDSYEGLRTYGKN